MQDLQELAYPLAWYKVVPIFCDTSILLDRPAITRLRTESEDDVFFVLHTTTLCQEWGTRLVAMSM